MFSFKKERCMHIFYTRKLASNIDHTHWKYFCLFAMALNYIFCHLDIYPCKDHTKHCAGDCIQSCVRPRDPIHTETNSIFLAKSTQQRKVIVKYWWRNISYKRIFTRHPTAKWQSKKPRRQFHTWSNFIGVNTRPSPPTNTYGKLPEFPVSCDNLTSDRISGD